MLSRIIMATSLNAIGMNSVVFLYFVIRTYKAAPETHTDRKSGRVNITRVESTRKIRVP
jgi:hypothetical protein